MPTEPGLFFRQLLSGQAGVRGLAGEYARDRLAEAARYAQDESLFDTPPPLAGPDLAYFEPLRARMAIARPLDAQSFGYLLKQYAPVALTQRHWLIPLAGIATVYRRPCALLFPFHADAGRYAQTYRALLLGRDILLAEVRDEAFIDAPDVLEEAWRPALLGLAIGAFPETLFPELLGLLLGQVLGLLPFRALLAQALGAALPPRDKGSDRIGAVLLDCLESARELGGTGALTETWRRVRNGLLAQFLAESGLVRAALEALCRPRDRRRAVLAILKAKRPYALGQHRDHRLRGRRIDDWLAPGADLGALLEALAASDWVDPARPHESPFLRLLSPEGPMHRVFREDEVAALVDWIASLAEVSGAAPEDPGPPIRLARRSPVAAPAEAADPRVLFHRLLNPEQYPDELPAAHALIQRVLKKTARALRSPFLGRDLECFPYKRAVFEARIDEVYHRALAAYRPFAPPPRLDREEYRWLLARLAPLVLVDGCWLQQAAWLEGRHAPVAARLLAIYSDEIGGGDPERHHANIFRRLLEGEGIRLPELRSPAFIAWSGFSAALFDLPAYLLAISQFPHRFLPEILGLNLAIELSGLGAFYMTAVDEMRYLGIDPAIVSVHLASDNLASGHAALAKEAIMIYLDQIGSDCGQEGLDENWRRVWLGYASLQVVPRRAWLALITRFLLHFGPARLKKALRGWPRARTV